MAQSSKPDSPPAPEGRRHLDLAALKALSHPLRVQMYDHLGIHGPNTASGLAEVTGESSGATSYHLRQLARHGFVRECADRGTGRERWWEVVPGGFSVEPEDVGEPASHEAHRAMLSESLRLREQHLRDFVDHQDSYEPEWRGKGIVSLSNVSMTVEQFEDFLERQQQLLEEVAGAAAGSPEPGARRIQIHCNAFPVRGGRIEPSDGGER